MQNEPNFIPRVVEPVTNYQLPFNQ
jgi:hypothetical protein